MRREASDDDDGDLGEIPVARGVQDVRLAAGLERRGWRGAELAGQRRPLRMEVASCERL